MSAGADADCLRRYAGCMRYAQGDGLTAEGHRRREQFRLDAASGFEQRVPSAVIAAELRVMSGQCGGGGRPGGLAGRPRWLLAGRRRSADWMAAAGGAGCGAGGRAAGRRVAGPAVDAAQVRDLVAGQVPGAVHHRGDLVPAATGRLDLPDRRAAGDRARRRRGRSVEEGVLAADKSTAAASAAGSSSKTSAASL